MQLNILVEGQTEEAFVKEILGPHLREQGIYATPIIISTRVIRDGSKFKGGLSIGNFDRFINDLKKLIHSTPHGYVTTMIDYYGLPSKFPNHAGRIKLPSQLEKVKFLEQSLFNYLKAPQNLIPYIQLHEFETFHFTTKDGFAANIDPREANLEELFQIVDHYNNPEDINEGTETAPSKRIKRVYNSYDKVVEGNVILLDIGINTLLAKCPHFKEWIDTILSKN